MTNNHTDNAIDMYNKNMSAISSITDTIETMRQEIIKLSYLCDKQNNLIKKYRRALHFAAIDYAHSVECEEKCNITFGNCNIHHECNHENHDTTFAGCEKFAMKKWKDIAGIKDGDE